jgi:hypothetical protein
VILRRMRLLFPRKFLLGYVYMIYIIAKYFLIATSKTNHHFFEGNSDSIGCQNKYCTYIVGKVGVATDG